MEQMPRSLAPEDQAPPPVHGTTKLLIEINGIRYTLRRIVSDPRVTAIAWRLTHADGRCYDLHKDEFGEILCDCRDFLVRRQGKDPKGCKHCAAAKAAGLFGIELMEIGVGP